MSSADTQLPTALHDLREGAALVAHASDSATKEDVPGALVQLEATLRELSAVCYSLGYVVVPRPHETWSEPRFNAGGAGRGSPASHERNALALATLHDVSASILASARRCRAAEEAVAPLAEPVVGGEHASPPPTGARVGAA